MAAKSHKELQKCQDFGNWVRKDIQYSQFQNYELTYGHFVRWNKQNKISNFTEISFKINLCRFPSWGIWLPGSSPGTADVQSCCNLDKILTSKPSDFRICPGLELGNRNIFILLISTLLLKIHPESRCSTLRNFRIFILISPSACSFKFPSWLGIIDAIFYCGLCSIELHV